jgi:hypothetical protein
LGSTSVTSPTSIRPTSRGSSEGCTVTDLTSTMLAFFEPAALKNLTPVTETVGVGSSESEIGPSITRSRPVAALTCWTISGL